MTVVLFGVVIFAFVMFVIMLTQTGGRGKR